VSVRERTEETLARRLLTQRGLCVYFSHGDPVVRAATGPHGAPAGPVLDDSAGIWSRAKVEAEAQYQAVLDAVDWNRVALEAVGAYLALDEGNDPTDFGSDARESGQAIKAALDTRCTWPNWTAYWAEQRDSSDTPRRSRAPR
jgi:hypothetical protein